MFDTENLTRLTLSRTLSFMPAALDVDREAVKTLVAAIGVREAARRMNLPEATVQAWSARFGWVRQLDAIKSEVTATNLQPVATKPSVALANVLAEDSLRTKIGFSRAAVKVATHLGEKAPDQLIERDTAQSARQWTEIAGKVHGWDAKQDGAGVNVAVNIGIIGG